MKRIIRSIKKWNKKLSIKKQRQEEITSSNIGEGRIIMPARAIIDLPEIPYSYSRRCSGCNYYIDGCYGSVCGLGEYDGYCAFREVPEWTEEDSKFINLWLNNVKCLQEKLGNEEIMALRTLKKLCKLARVEVEG